MRRLASLNGIAHVEKLEAVLAELKNAGILTGSQVPLANSFLSFRNNALHARWDKVSRVETETLLAFLNQILLVNF